MEEKDFLKRIDREGIEASEIALLVVDESSRILSDKDTALGTIFKFCAVPHWFDARIIEHLRALAPTSELSSRQILEELSQYPFINKHPLHGYAFHEEVRDYLIRRLRQQDDSLYSSVHRHLAEFFRKKIEQETDPKASLDLAQEMVFHLIGADENKGIDALRGYFENCERQHRLANCSGLVRALREHYETLSPSGRLWLRTYEAKMTYLQGAWETSKAKFLELGSSYVHMPDTLKIVYLQGKGLLHRSTGNWTEAIDAYEKCLNLIPGTHCEIRAEILKELALLRYRQGNWESSIELYRKSLSLFDQVGAPAGKSEVLYNLAKVRYRQGYWEESLAYVEQAIAGFREVQNQYQIAWAMLVQTRLLRRIRQYHRVVETAKKSAELFQKVGSQLGYARALQMVGEGCTFIGDYKSAEKYLLESLKIKRRLGDRDGEEQALDALSVLYGAAGRIQEAIALLEQAVDLSERLGDLYYRAKILRNLAEVKTHIQNYHEAIELYRESLGLSRQLGDLYGEQVVLTGLGKAFSGIGDRASAANHYIQALKILRLLAERNPNIPFLQTKIAEILRLRESNRESNHQ